VIVVLTAEAESDLEAIAEYIARDSVTAASAVVDELRENGSHWPTHRAAIRWYRATNATALVGARAAVT
jgi:hypothetical protein